MSNPITPCLWFDGTARDVADFYVATFPDARHAGGSGLVAEVEVGGQRLQLLNGGPHFKVNPAISLFHHCDDERQIDVLWDALAKDGTVMMPLDAYPFARKFGWVADRFGVSWQLSLPTGRPPARVHPSLLFTQAACGRAEEALRFYAETFDGSAIGALERYGPGLAPDREGTLYHGEVRLGNQWFTLMDSAYPHAFTFTEGVSLSVACEDQREIDRFWDRLTEGGSESRCGWLKDRFGVSWQVVPRILGELMADPERAKRVTAAFLPMKKLDIATLLKA